MKGDWARGISAALIKAPFPGKQRVMPDEEQPCVYILASGHYGTLYIGVTSDLPKRLWQHREGVFGGFTRKHDVKRLVHFELLGDMERAIRREKQLKNWHRQWKINLVNEMNPEWRDLAVGLGFDPLSPPAL